MNGSIRKKKRKSEKEQHEKEKWLKDNEARITELAEAVVGAMEETTMGIEKATDIDIVKRGWANYPQVFEAEWKQYQENGKNFGIKNSH